MSLVGADLVSGIRTRSPVPTTYPGFAETHAWGEGRPVKGAGSDCLLMVLPGLWFLVKWETSEI